MTKTDLKSLLKDPSLLAEQAYIGGDWVDGDNGTFEVTNPARGDVIANVAEVSLGPELLGRVIDGRGEPLDGKPAPLCTDRLSLLGRPINPMERGPIDAVLDVGVKAINGVLTVGRGQRLRVVHAGQEDAG